MSRSQVMKRLREARLVPAPMPEADRLWAQITDLPAAGEARPQEPRPWKRIGTRGALILGGMTALAAAAAAATLGLQIGSSVRPGRGASPTVGIGVPARGASRLLALRVPDPAGGPPWGMRVLRTTRGLLCVQIGRVYRGQLGLLGVDGAFGDDGRFHPLPARALSPDAPGGLPDAMGATVGPDGSPQQCVPPRTTFSGFASGITRGGTQARAYLPATQQRWASFGLLGAHARRVTYRVRGQERTSETEGPLGAYLVVLTGPAPGEPSGGASGGAFGQGRLDTVRPQPTGAITAITYRFGARTCSDSLPPAQARVARCPMPSTSHGRPGPLVNLHERIVVRLIGSGGRRAAILTFRAPYGVSSALSGYTIEQPTPCHEGTIETQVDRDLRRGRSVTTKIPDVFANACGRSVTFRVLYQPAGYRPPVIVGATTFGEPRLTGLS